MDRRSLWGAFVRLAFSILCAGITYTLWLGAFILYARPGNAVVRAIGWLLAPLATAAGFAAGMAMLERLTTTRRARFLHIMRWPLVGCAIGAGAIFLFGPMLIVFGMFVAGTASLVLREVLLSFREQMA